MRAHAYTHMYTKEYNAHMGTHMQEYTYMQTQRSTMWIIIHSVVWIYSQCHQPTVGLGVGDVILMIHFSYM